MNRQDIIGQNGNTGEHYIIALNGTKYKLINGIVHYEKKKEVWFQSMNQNWDYFLQNGRVVG